MKKFLVPGILAGLFLFLPLKSQATPIDVPYQIYFSTVAGSQVIISTRNFPSGVPSVNDNVALYQWCIDNVVLSAPAPSNFTMYWSTSALTTGTTGYSIVTSTTPYQAQWPYRDPFCVPVGSPVVTLKSSVAGSTITAQGYLWKGWNP